MFHGFLFLREARPIRIDLKRPRAEREVRLEAPDRPSLLRRALSEPLVHFVVLGLVLALLAQAYQRHADIYRIVVSPARVAELSRKYVLQFGEPPGPAVLERLVQDDLHDEVLFRQGLATKLDRDDEIVRRRVVQKEQFLIQNLDPPAEPSDAQLRAYYAAHAARYVASPRASFSHVYFASDRAGDAAAQARARAALARIPAGATRGPDLGDPFPDLYDFSAFEPEQTQRLFGHTPFADAVFAAPIGRWSGPYRSAYGWHLLYVSARVPSRQPPFAEVSAKVHEDYLQDAAELANKAAFDRIARRFTVVRADKGQAP